MGQEIDIVLMPIGGGVGFAFPAIPENVKGVYSANYQSFDIISRGTVKVPKGTSVTEFSWEGEFFGWKKQNESVVRKHRWWEPIECVKILRNWMENGTSLNLVISHTWVNADVTISSFQTTAYGAFGNIKYSIKFSVIKDLKIYTTDELHIATFVKKIIERVDPPAPPVNTYTVVQGDTLWGIATRMLGGGANWTALYDANADTIESTAWAHGMSGSDHGHWIWPGEVLVIP